MKVSISKRNSKLGKVSNVSLAPRISCLPSAPCFRKCYADKAYRMYPNCKWAWDNNTTLAKHYPDAYFNAIGDFLVKDKTKLFRWHTSGDILDQNYFDHMVELANHFKNKAFMAFTKRHDLIYTAAPSNLSMVLSMWPNWGKIDDSGLARAWLQNGNETRVPSKVIHCPGKCETCGICWRLNKLHKDVVFMQH